MPGEIVLVDDAAAQASRFVSALAALPNELPPWAVIGGFAVYVRLARVHRATGDVDTMTLHQDELVQIVLAQPAGERLRTGRFASPASRSTSWRFPASRTNCPGRRRPEPSTSSGATP